MFCHIYLNSFWVLQDLLKSDFDWHNLLEPFPYTKKYTRFIKIFLSASKQDELGEWVGWVKSRFRCLLSKVSIFYPFNLEVQHSGREEGRCLC